MSWDAKKLRLRMLVRMAGAILQSPTWVEK